MHMTPGGFQGHTKDVNKPERDSFQTFLQILRNEEYQYANIKNGPH